MPVAQPQGPSSPSPPQRGGSRFWTADHFARVTGGRWLSPPDDPAAALAGLSTDTRETRQGQAFLALRGEKFDGHDFLETAAAAGATLAIVDREASVPGLALLRVDDTLAALHALAADYRDALAGSGTRVIAVGGSNGKTTTRNLIHAVLSARFRGTQSPKSFNNHIGVPLTLLAAEEGDDFVVVEDGTNHPGEIAALGAIVRPDAAVITSIGHEHMEFFATLEAVAREEASLLGFVRPRGLAVTPEDPYPPTFARATPKGVSRLTLGAAGCRITSRGAIDERGQRFAFEGGPEVTLPLLGEHNALNAAAALAVGRSMGVQPESAAEALSRVTPVPMRLEFSRIGATPGVVVINDAYNANPDSMRAALHVLHRYRKPSPQGRRVAVLGDMRELGIDSESHHARLGEAVAETGAAHRGADPNPTDGIDLVVFIGVQSAAGTASLRRLWPAERVHHFPDWDPGTPNRVADLLAPGDVVLLKASRGMRLERLLPAIEAKFGGVSRGR